MWKDGEIYRCANPACGSEVTVSFVPPGVRGGDGSPVCCCGEKMGMIPRIVIP